MNKLLSKLKIAPLKGGRLYIFLLIIFIFGITFGSIFITIINETDKTSVLNQIASFFSNIKSGSINYLDVFKNSIVSNLLYITLIWVLGISIIGIPVIIFMLFLKGFILGFSIATIIAKYKFVGLIGALTYVFPHIVISALIIFLLSYYALRMSLNLLKAVIERKSINFSEIINKYSIIMLISVGGMIVASSIEAFVSPYIIKFFLLFI